MNLTLGGNITSQVPVSLLKDGTGDLILTGKNTFTGSLTVIDSETTPIIFPAGGFDPGLFNVVANFDVSGVMVLNPTAGSSNEVIGWFRL